MTNNKQAHDLNATFYGPSIPPPTRRHRRHHHHSCLCGLFCFLIKVFIALVFLIGLAILIFWLIFRPTGLKFHVTDASLNEFTLSNKNTLNYNLVVNLTAYNPNNRVGVHYKKLEALAYYEDQRFGYLTLNELDQGLNGTSVWRLVFKGQSFISLGDSNDELTEVNNEKVYSIVVRASLRYKLRFGTLTTSTIKSKIACELEVPLNGNGYKTTKCGLV